MTRPAGAAPLRGRVRVLRAGVLGTSSLGLALADQLAAGGHAPPPALLAVCAGLLGLTAVTATARRVRLPLLLGLLGGQQVLLHLALDAGAGAATCGGVDPHVGHAAGAVLRCAPGDSAAMAMPGWPMLLAHLLAAAATALLLLRGEQALWALADRVVRAATAAPSARRPRAAVLRAPRPRTVVAVAPLSPAAPRGPPVLVAR
ncbi:hypothetical protein GCM10009616_03520 [Microlunatus lacustris]